MNTDKMTATQRGRRWVEREMTRGWINTEQERETEKERKTERE